MSWYRIFRPFIFMLDPEKAHKAAIRFLKYDSRITTKRHKPKMLSQTICDIYFDSPVGMAAGFDKNAEVISPLLNRGFGFVEVGSVTPKAQQGNPLPRMFRLAKNDAVIQRLGFNNKGSDFFVSNLKKRRSAGVVGANIGKNKDTEHALDDYALLLEQVYGLSDYITVNISSPNTPGLRDLQNKDALQELLGGVMQKRDELAVANDTKIPVFLKIAPDMEDQALKDVADVALEKSVDGMIMTNTTIGLRDSLDSPHANEQGGLSGKPLFDLSTEILAKIYHYTEGKVPLIGVGGVASAEDAYIKLKAGASLVQLYTSFVYEGFGLVQEIERGLEKLLLADGYSSIGQVVGSEYKKYAKIND